MIDTVTRQPRALLHDVNLAIEPGEFAIIFGASGSGKSTLIDALSGRCPATAGAVLYNGLDLYTHFEAFRSSIGYVPQQDIVHRRITVGRALAYTARLRLPEDTSEREIERHVSHVLNRVGLSGKADVPIGTPEPLSDGFSPPEQAMGIGTDQRSDVYALGATLYLLLTGIRPPAAHERVAGADVIPPRQYAPSLPAAVDATILQALELSMARRHAGIAEFRAALAGSSDSADTAAAAPRTVPLGRTPAGDRAFIR